MEGVWDPDQVGPEWMTAVLDAGGGLGGGRVTEIEGTPIGTGQVGCNIRYRLTYDRPGGGPPSVVVKFASRSQTSRAAGVQTLTYETEVAFYRDLATTVEVCRPRCYFADVQPGTANVVLVLEDVDAVPGDQLAGCAPDAVVPVMEQAARLHGPRWADPTLLDLPWLAARAADPPDVGAIVALLWPEFCQRYRAQLTEESLEVGERLARPSTWLSDDPGPLTLCHSDFRLDNLLFGDPAGSRPVIVVDWQTVRLGSGVSDVSYFLSGALNPLDRRRVEQDMVRTYHERLCAYAIGDYPLERCWQDYRRHSFSGFFMAVAASMMVERTERGDQMFVTMANGAAAQAVDLGATELLR